MKKDKIPKIIHYCWFGNQQKPEIVQKCIASWKQYLSDYEFMEWNEETFDININAYVKQAYESKMYAFVSDYARVFALYNLGGIYLDTDVEVFKSFNDLLHHESFWGFEQGNYIATSTIGSKKNNSLIKMFLDSYKNRKFINEEGRCDSLTNVTVITKLLTKQGLIANGQYQEIEKLGAFYPQTYFSPYDYINCRNLKSNHTFTLHHFYKSWLPPKTRFKSMLKKSLANVIGGDNIYHLRKLFSSNNSF